MTVHGTRAFMAPMAIAQHHGRPGTPTHQAHVQSFYSHLKGERPHLTALADPAVLDRELARIRDEYNTVRPHAALGQLTPTTNTTAAARRSAAPAPPARPEHEPSASSTIEDAGDDSAHHAPSTGPRGLPNRWVETRPRSIKGSDTPQ